MVGPRKLTVTYTVPATLSADATNIPFWWNNTGNDWSLDETNAPTFTPITARTGSGSASDGTMWLTISLNRVSGAAAETGLASHVLTTGTTFTAQVGEVFDNLTASSNVIPDGTGVNLDFDFGAGAVNLTIAQYAQVVATFIEGEGASQS